MSGSLKFYSLVCLSRLATLGFDEIGSDRLERNTLDSKCIQFDCLESSSIR